MTKKANNDANDPKFRGGSFCLGDKGMEVNMLCAELEELEAQFDKIDLALENPKLTAEERLALQKDRQRLSHMIKEHQTSGHKGGPCFEE